MARNDFWTLHGKKLLVAGVIFSFLGAWLFGELTLSTDVETYLPETMPEASSFELISSRPADNQYLFSALANGSQIGYITAGQGQGYGGPMLVTAAWDNDGTILNILVPEDQETPSWYARIFDNDYFSQYIGRTFTDPFTLGEDIDSVAGATRSARGIAQGVYDGRLLLAEHLGQPFVGQKEQIKLGPPEYLLLIGLSLVVALRIIPGLRKMRWPRNAMLWFGLIIFGIALKGMLSLINFVVFPIGYAPSPVTNLYLYILVFGIIGLALIFAKNFWCFWICPFCALQEGAYFIAGGKVRPVTRRQLALRNTRYVILWAVVILVLVFRQPQLSVFEPWNTLFSLEGNLVQWLLVVAMLGIAMFIHDFWCHYLCPVGATMDVILKIRAWFAGIFGRLTAR
ncbi:4Fe-4S binding protein [Dehalogenimonas sp. THU2]|uniref:4Fe-4S binding protein n=1 Tax=Dehalogenimonas sp. THU2 TaxID=3151121 RepID=UPI003218467A